MVEVWKFIQDTIIGISGFWTWLTSPLKENFGALSALPIGEFKPIELLGIGGLLVILVFWIIKLINPLS